jgi:cytochrome P450
MEEHRERYGDIYRASIYESSVYVVSAPRYAEHVLLQNWQNYIRKGQAVKRIALSLGSGLISSNGGLWVKQRRMIQPAFNRDAIGALGGLIACANRALLNRWKLAAQRSATVNVTREVSLLTLEITLTAIFGEDYPKIAARFAIVAEEERSLAFARECNSLGKLVIQVAAQRREAKRTDTDILGMLMQARDREGGEPMSDAQLAREILTLIIAGHETTASVLNWTWYLLARHPEVEAKLSAELRSLLEAPSVDPVGEPSGEPFRKPFPEVAWFPKFTYTRQVIEEALRLYPPLWLMTRRAVSDDWLGDYFVPAGTEIYVSPFLIQRHPDLWEMPAQFEPDRFAPWESDERPRMAMCPFGAGPRNCIGEFLARIEMQTHLMIIARELRLRYDPAQPADMVAGTNLLSRGDFIMTPEMTAGILAGRLNLKTKGPRMDIT